MSKPSATLRIILEPSSRLRRFLIAVHGLAALAASANGLPAWGKIAAFAVLGSSAWHHLRKADYPPIVYLNRDGDQNWRIGLASGGELEGRLLPTTVVTRWLTVLHFRDAVGRFQAVPVWPDSVDRESYRRLCVCLRPPNPAV